MSATYKPALLKALARICRRTDSLLVDLTEIGQEFAKMYWNQVVVYHLRQASSVTKEAEVIRLIRGVAADLGTRVFSDLPDVSKANLSNKMAYVLTLDVLKRFHNSKPLSMAALYRWEKGETFITLSSSSQGFIRDNSTALELIANYHWAGFLEQCNRLAPRIIQKVARDGARRRSTLLPYLHLLYEDGENACFYCGKVFDDARRPVVDHVIPWSFLLDDPLWDLVLCCAQCNNAKSDWLPEGSFVERLIRQNAVRQRERLSGKASAFLGADDIEGLYQAAISVEWPRFWAPGAIAS